MNNLEQKLTKIDLNLLVALNVLLNERSVSRAAEALYITQPAMSKTLNRLRDLFDDPLFHRSSSGLIPSERAIELAQNLPNILNQVNGLLLPRAFNPKTCGQTFSISIPSLLCHSILMPLVLKLNKLAPNICIIDLPSESDPFPALEKGAYDFAIHITEPKSDQFGCTSLGSFRPNIFAKKSHPLVETRTSNRLIDFDDYKFVAYQVSPEDKLGFENPAERILRLFNFSPNVVYQSSHLSMITSLLEQSDCLLVAPSFMLNSVDFSDKFTSVYEFDIEKEHMLDLLLLESPRAKHGEAAQWLKSELLKTISIT
ncbi:LysR family transcriptional regulator [Colwellia psychrerythraea]|uniref:Transcriptional regulator, LysR family n=1 Tax=Colwellia psychrerythraea TaxID=28229 RepID=A0A099KTD2_COLPS|nr:LysR family transcriptional regulator [Colwellia psychrerythraea]KGJ94024.1 transcriptional regulator, LysR family [Colwellia psychrerythraea]